jgi:hypothetical protein
MNVWSSMKVRLHSTGLFNNSASTLGVLKRMSIGFPIPYCILEVLITCLSWFLRLILLPVDLVCEDCIHQAFVRTSCQFIARSGLLFETITWLIRAELRRYVHLRIAQANRAFKLLCYCYTDRVSTWLEFIFTQFWGRLGEETVVSFLVG